jgi:hypothetical protein
MIGKIRGIKHRALFKYVRIETNIVECTIATVKQDFVVYLTSTHEYHFKTDLLCLHFDSLNNLRLMTAFLEENLVVLRENSSTLQMTSIKKFSEQPHYSEWLSQIKSGVLNPDEIKSHKDEFFGEVE